MAAAFVGQILLTVQGLPVLHCKSARPRTRTGKKLVKGMSPTGTAIGHTGGTMEYELDLELYIPRTGDIPWERIEGAVLMYVPRDGGTPTTYMGGFVTEVGETFNEDDSATRSVSMAFTAKLP